MNSSCVVARSLEEHLIGKKAKHRLKRGAFPTLQPQREPTASTGTKRLRSHGDHNSLGEVVTTSPVPLVTASLLAPNWPGPSHAPTAGTDDAVLRCSVQVDSGNHCKMQEMAHRCFADRVLFADQLDFREHAFSVQCSCLYLDCILSGVYSCKISADIFRRLFRSETPVSR
ncbi:zinc finger protein 493-like isoform X2 [Ixodes scapularis]